MNEQELKSTLLQIRETKNFNLYFTGKAHKKIDGFYKPDSKEIYINNCNFSNDNEMLLTALHEYAHHIHFTESFVKGNPHDTEFYKIYHELLFLAEEKGFYENCCRTTHEEDFNRMLKANERFNKEMERFFMEVVAFAQSMEKKNANQFYDACERFLKIPRNEIEKIFKALERMVIDGYQYATVMKLATMKEPDSDLLNKLRFETVKNKPDKSITFDMFKFYNADKKFSTEIAYLQDKKEKLSEALEKGKMKISETIGKINKLIRKTYEAERI